MTEDRLGAALNMRAAAFTAAPDLPGTLVRARGIRRRRNRRSVAAGMVVVAAVASAVLQLNASPDTDTSAKLLTTLTPIAAGPLSDRARSAYLSIGTDVYVWGGDRTSVTDGGHLIGQLKGAPGPREGTDASGNLNESDGAVYHSTTNSWQLLAPSPLSPRVDPAAVALNGTMLVLGGTSLTSVDLDAQPEGIGLPRYLRDGAVYDPARDTWESIPAAPLCVDRATGVDGLVIAGGTNCSRQNGRPAFASYDPSSKLWTTIAAPGWTLSSLMTYDGAAVAVGVGGQVAEYSPADGRWTAMPAAPTSPGLSLLYASDGGTLVAVAGSLSGGKETTVYALAPQGWHRVARFRQDDGGSLRPDQNPVAISNGTVLWHEERTIVWVSLSTGRHHSLSVWGLSGSVSDPAWSEPLPVGATRFVIWGGRDGAVFPGTTHLLSSGAVLSVTP